MRLSSIFIKGVSGLDLVEIQGLSDVVVLAGPNGVGKTRLLRALIEFFHDPRVREDLHLTFQTTCATEQAA